MRQLPHRVDRFEALDQIKKPKRKKKKKNKKEKKRGEIKALANEIKRRKRTFASSVFDLREAQRFHLYLGGTAIIAPVHVEEGRHWRKKKKKRKG